MRCGSCRRVSTRRISESDISNLDVVTLGIAHALRKEFEAYKGAHP
jgi:hypothetical protein